MKRMEGVETTDASVPGCGPESEQNAERTAYAVGRVQAEGVYFEPSDEYELGLFRGRPIIGRGTRINGGVYLGGERREAIVVDDAKEPILREVYRDLLNRVTVNDEVHKERILQGVFDTVQEWMPYDHERTEEIAAPYYGDQKIGLGMFVGAAAGVCRHQALLSGYLLERLKEEGYIRGEVSVRRNTVPGVGAHGWAEYTSRSGIEYVIDPAQRYLGRKTDAHPRGRWRY